MARKTGYARSNFFSLCMFRKLKLPDGFRKEVAINDYAHDLYRNYYGNAVGVPDCFVTPNDLTLMHHIHIQATIQKYIDGSISKTIN
jgi:ribonucleoside-diphosphate reductase alpha chain